MPQPTTEPPKDIQYLNLSDSHQRHISDQAKKRQISPNEVLFECVEYHKENAGT